MKLFAFLSSALFVATLSAEEEAPVVETSNGFLRGKFMKTNNGRKLYAFTSIPYAKPPVGELRFQPPVPAEPWEGIKDATAIHSDCPQRNIYTRSPKIEGQEDCLYLNVYTPNLPKDSDDLLPVMMFLHGGGWLCGGGNTNWYGPETLLDRDVVLVVPNYRLGALGFLTTGDEIVPGNNGLKDQNLVLKWIQANIARFGGDPKSVTIFGESAGGASAQYHMLSPMSRGLFSGAMSHSGTAFCTWALAPKDQGVRHSKKLAELLKCPTKSNKEMVKCLRKIDAQKIIAQDKNFMGWDFDPMIPFKPVIEAKVEGAFLTEHPADIIKAGKAAAVPWVTGINTEDGALRAAGIYGNPHLVDELNDDFDRVVPISLLYDETSNEVEYVTKKIRDFYFGDRKIDNSTKKEVTNMYTDSWFLVGSDDAVRIQTQYSKAPVYYYLFGYRGVISFTTIFGDPGKDYGVCHVDELLYLFPIQFDPDVARDQTDREMEKLMTNMWVNFAKTGNPTPKLNDQIKNKWTPSSTTKLEYYFIKGPQNAKMEEGLFLDRAKFWRKLPIDSKRTQILRDEL